MARATRAAFHVYITSGRRREKKSSHQVSAREICRDVSRHSGESSISEAHFARPHMHNAPGLHYYLITAITARERA